jgi:hypothetical protein
MFVFLNGSLTVVRIVDQVKTTVGTRGAIKVAIKGGAEEMSGSRMEDVDMKMLLVQSAQILERATIQVLILRPRSPLIVERNLAILASKNLLVVDSKDHLVAAAAGKKMRQQHFVNIDKI